MSRRFHLAEVDGGNRWAGPSVTRRLRNSTIVTFRPRDSELADADAIDGYLYKHYQEK